MRFSVAKKAGVASALVLASAAAMAADPVVPVDTAVLIDSFVAAFPVVKVTQAVASICISLIGLVAITFAYRHIRSHFNK